MSGGNALPALINHLYVEESRRVFASLVRLLGDFDLAEEALQEAFAAAIEQWPREGVPANPRAWLVSTGRFKGIDRIRREARRQASLDDLSRRMRRVEAEPGDLDESRLRDDQLRLIFTCCHPALAESARVPLTLREVCGLTTDEVARAFLASPATIAQRIVRGKAKIRDAGIPFSIPTVEELPDRIDSVLAVIYLVFNEGYSATAGESATRPDLTGEAIRLTRLLRDLLPEPEVTGLLALMLLHDSRRMTRIDERGDLVLLEDQDRSRWNHERIEEGCRLVEEALRSGRFGPYSVQGAIAAVHAEAESFEATDWNQIVALYDLLNRMTPSPVIELNRAVAIAQRDGPATGLELVEPLIADGALAGYHLAHAAAGDFQRRLGNRQSARQAYRRALDLAGQEPERRFLRRRLDELEE
jgi:RNA polymerase sigma-70 factor, ECF subfamily